MKGEGWRRPGSFLLSGLCHRFQVFLHSMEKAAGGVVREVVVTALVDEVETSTWEFQMGIGSLGPTSSEN